MSFVYILKSLVTNEYYIGCSDNYVRRIDEHQKGKSSATIGLRPFRVMLVQEYAKLSIARTIESRLKKLKRRDYIDKIVRDGKILMDP